VSGPLKTGFLLRDRYQIEQIIGRGGMGSIYLAEDTRLPGRLCAVKQVEHGLDLTDELQAQSRQQFYREASVLARLDHPNLPKVSDYFTEAGSDYLVMDFVPGNDLKAVMDQARREGSFLRKKDVLGWADQLADALEYLHRQEPPVIHRDIKPSNLKLNPNGLIKLVDFGLVKQMIPDEMTVTVIQGRGTAKYTPLEQYGGDTGHTDPRSDIYAFGATLYHLLTNHPPMEAKQRFLNPELFERPSHFNPEIDNEVENAILWAMALHPDQRPSNVATMRLALIEGEGVINFHRIQRSSTGILKRLLPTVTDRILALSAIILLLIAALASIF
jgi:serine/threonine-protein kinase